MIMEFTIIQPKITTLYGPSRRISWCNVPTGPVTSVIDKAIESALMRSMTHPNDHPVMIELKE